MLISLCLKPLKEETSSRRKPRNPSSVKISCEEPIKSQRVRQTEPSRKAGLLTAWSRHDSCCRPRHEHCSTDVTRNELQCPFGSHGRYDRNPCTQGLSREIRGSHLRVSQELWEYRMQIGLSVLCLNPRFPRSTIALVYGHEGLQIYSQATLLWLAS